MTPDSPPPPASSREERWGGYWLPRLGVLVLLTGLVYLAHHVFRQTAGAGGSILKLALMYAGGFGLLRLGLLLERREHLNFGRILISGAGGAIFYTTFAAYHVATLRVLPSAVLDAILLLACAAWMIGLAERRQSQPMALLALLLAYYTTIATASPPFAFSANFALALAAAWLLHRHGWAGLAFTILPATYFRFVDWKLFGAGRWDLIHFLETGGNLWLFHVFFAAYWIMFTVPGRRQRRR